MSLFSKIGGAISKVGSASASVVKKISSSPIASAAIGLIPGGNVAKSAIGFVTQIGAKGGDSISMPNIEPQNPVQVSAEVKNRSIAAKAAAVASDPAGGKVAAFFRSAWTFIKANWMYIAPAVLVVFFLLVKFFWKKKPMRRRSHRRVAAAARARSAKAAKRRR